MCIGCLLICDIIRDLQSDCQRRRLAIGKFVPAFFSVAIFSPAPPTLNATEIHMVQLATNRIATNSDASNSGIPAPKKNISIEYISRLHYIPVSIRTNIDIIHIVNIDGWLDIAICFFVCADLFCLPPSALAPLRYLLCRACACVGASNSSSPSCPSTLFLVRPYFFPRKQTTWVFVFFLGQLPPQLAVCRLVIFDWYALRCEIHT